MRIIIRRNYATSLISVLLLLCSQWVLAAGPAPNTDAGPDQTVDEGVTVTFDGSGSSVGGNVSISSYVWSSSEFGADLNGVAPTFQFNTAGNYSVTLTCTTTGGRSTSDTMTVTVNAAAVTPAVADAGSDGSVDFGDAYIFDGSNSTPSPGETITTYTWTSAGFGSAQTGATPSYTFATWGTHSVTLTITDSAAEVDADVMEVTVNPPPSPIANGGADVVVTEGDTAFFDGTSSSATAPATINDYSWDISSLGASLSGSDTWSLVTQVGWAGSYLLTLTVTDTNGLTDTDEVTLVIQPAAAAGTNFATTPMFLQCTGNVSGSGSSVAFNTSTLSTDSSVFLSFFHSSKWSGELVSYALDPVDGTVSSTEQWDSATVLDARNLATNDRTIITYDGTDGIPFQYASLTASQKADLKENPDGSTSNDTVAENRLDYLRGDRSLESSSADGITSFRERDSRNGDIIYSTPVYVGSPEMPWPNTSPFPTASGETYDDFSEGAAQTRTEAIYVGANDGMLHGFRVSDGAELLAYVPGSVFSSSADTGLHFLTDPAYDHHYYVDLSPTVADAHMIAEPAGSDAWRTILVGGQRIGGRGYFALDITDPTDFTEANADDISLWEFTSDDDSDMGYTFSQATIGLMNNGEWAAIVGNGYNSTAGDAKLFIIFLEGGLDGDWVDSGDYIEISTGVSPDNGLSTPAVIDTDGNGTMDRVYAGDLKGNLWAFDLSDSSTSNWAVDYKLFEAGSSKPITVEPTVGIHPTIADSGSNSPNLMVYFGTGQYMYTSDPTTTDTQSFFGIWDAGSGGFDASDLQQQTFVSGFGDDVRVLSNEEVGYELNGSNQEDGWYFNMPIAGERVVSSATLRGSLVYFNTLVPSSIPCSYGFLMAVRQVDGGRPQGAAFDVNLDGVIDNDDLQTNEDSSLSNVGAVGTKFLNGIPSKSGFLSNYQYTAHTSADDGSDIQSREIEYLGGDGTGRRGWEDLSIPQ